MLHDYSTALKSLPGHTLPKPPSGTLSGHNAGEPFEKLVYAELKKAFPNRVFKQFEYLNDLYLKNPKALTYDERNALLHSELVSFLLSRGKEATAKWSVSSPFEEKQNDTADIIVVENGCYDLIDVKTRNSSKSAQPPNIISAYKLAQAMKIMLDTKAFDLIDLIYIEVDWSLNQNSLLASKIHVADLFQCNPSKLYINWAAAMQIQFHVCDLDQSFTGTREEWAREYLTSYYHQAMKRAEEMKTKFADPFHAYTNP